MTGIGSPSLHDLESDPGNKGAQSQRMVDNKRSRLKALARALYVDEDWLLGSAPDATQPMMSTWLHLACHQAGTEPVPAFPESPCAFVRLEELYELQEAYHAAGTDIDAQNSHIDLVAMTLRSDLANKWNDLLFLAKDGRTQKVLIKITSQPDADGQPWPLFQRGDLVTDNAFVGLSPWPPSRLFTPGQLAVLGPALLPAVPDERWRALITQERSRRQSRHWRRIPPVTTCSSADEERLCQLLGVPGSVFRRRNGATYETLLKAGESAMQQALEHQIAVDKTREAAPRTPAKRTSCIKIDAPCPSITNILEGISLAFRLQFPRDQAMPLPEIISAFRAWRQVATMAPTPPDPRYYHRLLSYRGCILSHKHVITLITDAVGPKRAENKLRQYMGKGLLIPIAHQSNAPAKDRYMLVADDDDHRRWMSNPSVKRPSVAPSASQTPSVK